MIIPTRRGGKQYKRRRSVSRDNKEQRRETQIRGRTETRCQDRATLKWPSDEDGEKECGKEKEEKMEDRKQEDDGTWMKGGREEDNKR